MEQRLAALFASVVNALDSQTYTYSDSDYLVRKALVKFLEEENTLVASARRIPDPEQVVESVLNYIISTDYDKSPDFWYRKAMSVVVDFADFAYKNEMNEYSARYAALLPDGHPRVLRITEITASAARKSLAEWLAADPRLDEEASAQVYKLYSMDDSIDDVEADFELLKTEAMVAAGKMPEDLLPIVAGFNLSFAQRSAISKALAAVRRRDRKGRFAEEFGRLKLFFKNQGQFFSESPRIVGAGRGDNSYKVEFDGDGRVPKGIYEVDAALGENVKAYLPKKAVKSLRGRSEIVSEADKKFAIELDEFVKTRQDAPDNWEKSGKGFKSKDGKFTATPISSDEAQKFLDKAAERGDETIISGTGAGDAFDPENKNAFLVADSKGRTKGIAQDWAGIQEIGVANGMSLTSTPTSSRTQTRPEGVSEDAIYVPRGMDPIGGGNAESAHWLEPDGTKIWVDESGNVSGPIAPRKPKAIDIDTIEFQRPDLGQDVGQPLDKNNLSADLLAEGYQFSKDGENSWTYQGSDYDGDFALEVSKDDNGRWFITRTDFGSDGSGIGDRSSGVGGPYDNPQDAFEEAASLAGNEWDEDWVNELLSEDSPELNQGISPRDAEIARNSQVRVDREGLDPAELEKYGPMLDNIDSAISDNNFSEYAKLRERAAGDKELSDEMYRSISNAKEAFSNREAFVENAIYGGDREEIESLLEDSGYSGWHSRLQDALDELDSPDLGQDAPVLSEKQSEPATGKQYSFLQEFLDERQFDPATEQSIKDAIENKNLNKAQASALIGLGRSADFKEGVDPNKPSERMLNSLQGYLATKDLTPTEIRDTLDSLEADGSRSNVDALLNKLRRKKDKPVELNQGTGSLIKVDDEQYEWEDAYNSINVFKDGNRWDVEYTTPDPQERGRQLWSIRSFEDGDQALAFAESIVKENQKDDGYARYRNEYLDLVVRSRDPELDQDVKGTLEDAATDKQWSFLESLLNGKQIDDPILKAAVRSAVEEKNLTKGEVGAFIGQLRPLADKPDVRREPSAKQLASIRRAIQERDVTPEEFNDIRDRLEAGMSFDEASEILNDLKSRPITETGITNLLSVLEDDLDLDTLLYIVDKPEYADFVDEIRETIEDVRQQLAEESPDLGQDVNQGLVKVDDENYEWSDDYNTVDVAKTDKGWTVYYTTPDLRDRGGSNWSEDNFKTEKDALDFAEKLIKENKDDGGYDRARELEYQRADGINDLGQDIEDRYDNLDNDLKQEIDDAIQRANFGFNKVENDLYQKLEDKEISGQEFDSALEELTLDREEFEYMAKNREYRNMDYFQNGGKDNISDVSEAAEDVLEAWNIHMNRQERRSRASDEDIELDQNLPDLPGLPYVPAAFAPEILRLANELDAATEQKFLVFNGSDLKRAVNEFDSEDDPRFALSWLEDIRNGSRYVRDVNPDLARDLNTLADKMEDIRVNKYGIARAATVNPSDPEDWIDLDDVVDNIEREVEMHFETDPDKIAELLDNSDFYGDERSGGAGVFIREEEEDGTWTATVIYDRDSEEFKSDDRDEVVKDAADAAAGYNSDTKPGAYYDFENLADEAKEAKTPDAASQLADRMDDLADALREHRGDRDLALSLREYGERIRDMIEKRERQNQEQAPSEPTTPETMEEMATDPELNPKGYADSVGNDLFSKMQGNEENGLVNSGEYTSNDGRVKVIITTDADFNGENFTDASSYEIEIDGNRVGSGSGANADDISGDAAAAAEEYFSKKA